jgi:hypothetical protein
MVIITLGFGFVTVVFTCMVVSIISDKITGSDYGKMDWELLIIAVLCMLAFAFLTFVSLNR